MNDEYQLLKKLGGRKFALAVLAYIGTSILVGFGFIDPGVYATVTLGVVVGYITGNVLEAKNGTV